MPFEAGNKAGSRQYRLWGDTIKRAVRQGNSERLRKLAEALLDKAESGDVPALREIGDRLDGRAAQQIIHSGDEENPVKVLARIERAIVDIGSGD